MPSYGAIVCNIVGRRLRVKIQSFSGIPPRRWHYVFKKARGLVSSQGTGKDDEEDTEDEDGAGMAARKERGAEEEKGAIDA